MNMINIGMIGFGTVGSGVLKILQKNKALLDDRVGIPLNVKCIADLDIESDRGVPVDPSVLTTDARQILDDPDIPIVLELIGGNEPACRFILEALRKGKHVVTANKALLAERGDEIFHAARVGGVDIAFEAAVAGGVPILRSLREGLVANRFEKVMAILNGTSNFILTAMHEQPGVSFDEMLKQAQALGYAEADPTLDVDGMDAAHKLAIVLRLTHGIHVPLNKIFVQGISEIDPYDVRMAREFSYKIKLLAIIITHGEDVEVRLHPTMIPERHPLGGVDGVFNGIYLRGDMVGEQLFYGRGAGRDCTASAVLGDVVEIARNIVRGTTCRIPPLGYREDREATGTISDMNKIFTNYYLRVQARDRPGVLARIAGIMSSRNISIHSVMQKDRDESKNVPVVFVTHQARETDIQEACRIIGELDMVEGVPTVIRIEDESLD